MHSHRGRWERGKRRPKKLEQVIFNKYFYHKQTLRQLFDEYHRSIPWVKKHIFEFDPEVHQAIMQVESNEHKEGDVVQVMQKGYMIKENSVKINFNY